MILICIIAEPLFTFLTKTYLDLRYAYTQYGTRVSRSNFQLIKDPDLLQSYTLYRTTVGLHQEFELRNFSATFCTEEPHRISSAFLK